MPRDKDRVKSITRRALLLGGGQLALFGTLVGRMYYLQVVEASKYALLADQNRISLRLVPQVRGRILDRNGTPVAVNQQNYRALVVPEDVDDIGETLDALSRIFNLSDRDRDRIQREADRLPGFVPVLVRENLSWEEMSRVELNAPELPGVAIDVGQARDYPFADLGAHIIGYVAAVSEQDLQDSNDPVLELPGFRIGKAGVEKIYDMDLRGKVGTSQVEVNSVGRVIRELRREEGEPGQDLRLTIDFDLQQFAHARLGEESAAAVVLDIQTGDVLVMASNPSYDPNAFNRGLTGDEWKDLSTDPKAPLTNKAIAGQYAPGSTFKLMTALAALETGTINPDFKVFCPGQISLGDAVFHCWRHGGHGTLDLVGGLKNSCDVYFYEVARRTGFDHIADMARRFGMGAPTGIDLVNERPGLIPDKAWKEATLGQPWHPGETLINGIGQGYVTATPLQLALMTARVANDGIAITPRVARLAGAPDPAPSFPPMNLARSSLAAVKRGMNAVVNEIGGTGFAMRIKDPAMAMAGKSGTAQVRRITARERAEGIPKEDALPWKDRDNAMFVAFAPVAAPRYAVAVCIEHGGGGAAAAEPIARDILIEVQKRAIALDSAGSPAPVRRSDAGHDHGDGHDDGQGDGHA